MVQQQDASTTAEWNDGEHGYAEGDPDKAIERM